MVNAMIDINDRINRILNIVKAKYGLRNKSEAIEFVVSQYEEECLEPQLRPEYEKKLEKIIKGKHFSRTELEKRVE